MRCAICDGKTGVLESDTEGAMQRRRRVCQACGARTTTIEASLEVLERYGLRYEELRTGNGPRRRRLRQQREYKKQKYAADPEHVRETWRRSFTRKQARKQAAETGENLSELYRAWGVEDRRRAR